MEQPLKVFIVDDSALYRRILTNSVDGIPVPTEVDTAPTGAIALKKIPLFGPDIVLLDIEMPEMSGIEVLKAIRKDYPRMTVVLVSGVNSRSADITIEGLSSGASDFIPKPTGSSIEENTAELRRGLQQVFNLILAKRAARGGVRATRLAPAAQARPKLRPLPSILPARIEIVGIGVSTGGPGALGVVIPQLPKNISVPVVIVQHMPPVFTESLARSLDRSSAVSVCEAEDGQVLRAGNVYIAPGGVHTMVKRFAVQEQQQLMIRLNDGPPVNSCKPAVDVLFDSLATVTGGRTLAVVMTDMGHDGKSGAQHIKARQGYCLSQSEETCTVYGMPQAVDQARISDESVALPDLAGRIYSVTNGTAI